MTVLTIYNDSLMNKIVKNIHVYIFLHWISDFVIYFMYGMWIYVGMFRIYMTYV